MGIFSLTKQEGMMHDFIRRTFRWLGFRRSPSVSNQTYELLKELTLLCCIFHLMDLKLVVVENVRSLVLDVIPIVASEAHSIGF